MTTIPLPQICRLTLINKLRSRKVGRSRTGIIVEDIKQLMRVSSVVFSFIHVSRNSNEVAHALAKAISNKETQNQDLFHVLDSATVYE